MFGLTLHSEWRREALRTNLWLVPALEVLAAATFIYATLVLISIGPGTFVPHLSITVAVALVALSMGILIFFIHHIATTIQLPQVIASIAQDLRRAIETESVSVGGTIEAGPSVDELLRRMAEGGGTVGAPASGYLQFVRHHALIQLAAEKGAVIRLLQRPGHFVVSGHPMATVWPPQAAAEVSQALRRRRSPASTGSRRSGRQGGACLRS